MFCVDSKPVPVCRFARAKRCKLGKNDYATAPSFGYCASQNCYFFGYKLHALCGINGMADHQMGNKYKFDAYMRGRQYYYGFTFAKCV